MEEVDFTLNGRSTGKVYGVKSIAICGSPFSATPILTEHEAYETINFNAGRNEFKLEIIDMDPVLVRMLFPKPKVKIITTKLKHYLFARPVYMPEHVPREWTVKQVRSLQVFTRACYNLIS